MKLPKIKTALPLVVVLLASIFAMPRTNAQGLDALLDINRFRITDSTAMLEVSMLVAGNSVRFMPAGKGKFQAKVAVTIQISDSVGIRAADKAMMLSPVVTDTAGARPNFQMVKRFLLPNGKYDLLIVSADANSKNPEGRAEVPVALDFGKKKSIQLSDIQLLSSFQKTDKKESSESFVRNGFELIPAMTNFYPPAVNDFAFYTEVYRAAEVLGPDESFLVTYGIYPERSREPLPEFSKHSKQKAQPVNILLSSFDITKLPSGNYRFVVEVRNRENKLLAAQQKLIQRSNLEASNLAATRPNTSSASGLTFAKDVDSTKLDLYLMSLQPVANTNEMSFITGLVKAKNTQDKRKYLEHFWQKRGENPAALWADYKNRIDYVETTFGLRNYRGYQTDRGRVYLQYGPPNKIDNERTDVNRRHTSTDIIPYQIWHYYHIGNHNNKVFVFVQSNLGNDNFRLTHSDMPGEVNFPDWRKEIVQQKFSGSKFDRQ